MSQTLFLILVIDIVIFVCLSQSKFNSNKCLRKIIIFICSLLYNFILGYYVDAIAIFLVFFNLAIFKNETLFWLVMIIEVLVLFVLLLLPVNWIAKKESEINLVVCIITTIITVSIGILTYFYG